MALWPEKVSIRRGEWSDLDRQYFGGYLSSPEVDVLKELIAAGRYELWRVNEYWRHVASLATRTDTDWDGARHYDLCHVGGGFTRHLGAIDAHVTAEAKARGCDFLRVFCGRPELARRLLEKHGCTLYETIVRRRL